MKAPTIQGIYNSSPESLWSFLWALPSSFEAMTLYALVLGAVVGMCAHYITRWATGDIAGSLLNYLFLQNPRATVLAVIGILVELCGEIGTGLFTSQSGEFVGWGLVLLSGLKTGYVGDSIANKGTRVAWTEEQRTATVAPGKTPSPNPPGPVPPATT